MVYESGSPTSIWAYFEKRRACRGITRNKSKLVFKTIATNTQVCHEHQKRLTCVKITNWNSTCLTVEAIVDPVDDIHRGGLKNDEPGFVFLDRGLLRLGDALDVIDI